MGRQNCGNDWRSGEMVTVMLAEDHVISDLRTKRDQVLALLERYPQTRDNDFYLQLMWLRQFGNLSVAIPYIPFNEIQKLGGSLESVRRVRQKIQNEDGLFPPSLEVQAKRGKRAEIIRCHITEF